MAGLICSGYKIDLNQGMDARLVTSDLDNASRRVEALKGLRGINLYAQAERNESLGIRPGKAQLEFAQRYVYGGVFAGRHGKNVPRKGE